MYLSRLILNPRSRQVQREIADPVEMHRTLLKAFNATRQEAQVLFRVDVNRATGTPTVLVQSADEPDWSFVYQFDRYLKANGMDAELNPAVKSFAPAFSVGKILQFRLRANPTVKRNGKRLGLLTEDDQRQWLFNKAKQTGIEIITCHVVPEGFTGGTKTIGNDEHNIKVLSVRFDGVLQVVHPDELLKAMKAGIGSQKAYGFGLLSLAPQH